MKVRPLFSYNNVIFIGSTWKGFGVLSVRESPPLPPLATVSGIVSCASRRFGRRNFSPQRVMSRKEVDNRIWRLKPNKDQSEFSEQLRYSGDLFGMSEDRPHLLPQGLFATWSRKQTHFTPSPLHGLIHLCVVWSLRKTEIQNSGKLNHTVHGRQPHSRSLHWDQADTDRTPRMGKCWRWISKVETFLRHRKTRRCRSTEVYGLRCRGWTRQRRWGNLERRPSPTFYRYTRWTLSELNEVYSLMCNTL